MRAVITGASGFVGSKLCIALRGNDLCIRAIVKSASKIVNYPDVEFSLINDIGPFTDWNEALGGVDIVFHLAARAHIINERSGLHLEGYRRVNVEGTRKLAEIAAQKGVKRIVYLSTIKVNGEVTIDRPFSEDDRPAPQDSYAISKLEGEEAIRKISDRYGMEFVIIRSPLVYGPGVKGNLLRLLNQIYRGIPLPLGNIMNKRSLISLDNLVDALILSATRPECAGHTFLVSDGQDLSTTELYGLIAGAMGKNNNRVFPFPHKIFKLASRCSPSLRSLSDRLAGSLVVDSSKFRDMLSWSPPQTVAAGVQSMVSYYISGKKNAF